MEAQHYKDVDSYLSSSIIDDNWIREIVESLDDVDVNAIVHDLIFLFKSSYAMLYIYMLSFPFCFLFDLGRVMLFGPTHVYLLIKFDF